MKINRCLACLLAGMMLCGAFTACTAANGSTTETEPVTEAPTEEPTEATEEVTEEETLAYAKGIDALPGQAYLAIVDSSLWVQYWGSSTDEGSMLSYEAGVADITGNGTYTVSVNAATKGFRFETTGDINGNYTPKGLSFLGVIIPEGELKYPGIILTVDSIKVDGEEIALKAKNYTSSENMVDTRTNLYYPYSKVPSTDARSVDGPLYDGDTALPVSSGYSPKVIDPSDFATWTKVEVTFTVSNFRRSASPEDEAASEEAPEPVTEDPAEDTTASP